MSTLWELQKAVFDHLDLSVPLYDKVPQGSDFPYVTYNGADADADDRLNARQDNVSLSFNVWSRAGGMKEIQQIMGELYDALHRTRLSLPQGSVYSVTVTRRRTARDDTDTYIGQVSALARIRH